MENLAPFALFLIAFCGLAVMVAIPWFVMTKVVGFAARSTKKTYKSIRH